MNKIITIIIVLVLIVGGYMLFKDRGITPLDSNMETENTTETSDTTIINSTTTVNLPPLGTPTVPVQGGTQTTGVVKEFTVDGTPYKFSPATMTVNKGDTVKITFANKQGTHDLRIDEFNVATKVLQAGQSETITFVASKTGTFEYYCTVGNHRAMGMVGSLKVN